MKRSQIRLLRLTFYKPLLCVLIGALVIHWIDQYPYDRIVIGTTHGYIQTGLLPHYARRAMQIYVIVLNVLFIAFLYGRSDSTRNTNPAAVREAEALQDHRRSPSRHRVPNILFCLLILPFLLPAMIGPFAPHYVKQLHFLPGDTIFYGRLNAFVYLTSPPILAILFACALPILAYYGVFSRCLNFLRSHFGKRL